MLTLTATRDSSGSRTSPTAIERASFSSRTGQSSLDSITSCRRRRSQWARTVRSSPNRWSGSTGAGSPTPAPTGLGIKTSESALNRFRQRYKENLHRQSKKTRLNEIETIVVDNHGDMFHSAVQLMEARLIKALANDNTNIGDLQGLSRSIATLRRQALAEGAPVRPYAPEPKQVQPQLDYEL